MDKLYFESLVRLVIVALGYRLQFKYNYDPNDIQLMIREEKSIEVSGKSHTTFLSEQICLILDQANIEGLDKQDLRKISDAVMVRVIKRL